MILHLLYISQTTPLFSEDSDLIRIVRSSMKNNKDLEVTGMLVKNGNFFIQLLEGKERAVMKVYNEIAHDRRHSNIKSLMTFQNATRIFPEWYMGLVDSKVHDVSIRELVPYLHEDVLKIDGSKEKVISILKKFNTISEAKS